MYLSSKRIWVKAVELCYMLLLPYIGIFGKGELSPAGGGGTAVVGVHPHAALQQWEHCPGHQNSERAKSGPYAPQDMKGEVVVFSPL